MATVHKAQFSVTRRMSASPWRAVRQSWDAVLVLSVSLAVVPSAASFSPAEQGFIYLMLAVSAFGVVWRRLYPILRDNGHFLRAQVGLRPSRPPARYVRALFDDYADHFDRHLMIELSYRAPNLIVGIVGDRLDGTPPVVLDLGCGTGICGPLFAPFARSMIGVDLSPNMLDLARRKACYDRLVEADLVDFLGEQNETADVCIAADVLVYFGDLDAPFAGVWRALRPGGLFAFTVEATDADGWQLEKSARYAHSRDYVASRASAAGFDVLDTWRAILRQQSAATVPGDVWLLRKPLVR